jgi:flagellar motor switch protein FliG
MLEINQRRALEGEIARTLRTLDRVDDAIVHLAVTESVIDIRGRTLATPNSGTETGALGNRNMRRTREFEQQLESDISRMLLTTGAGDRATVVGLADLNFDETTIQQQSYDNESQVALRESSRLEEFTGDGSGTLPSGITGIDGGSLTRGAVPTAEQVRELVSAAVGLDPTRGDTIAVTSVPYPAASATPALALTPTVTPTNPVTNPLPQAAGAAVLLLVAIALIVMVRGRQGEELAPALEAAPVQAALPSQADQTLEMQDEVAALVQRQPEEIELLALEISRLGQLSSDEISAIVAEFHTLTTVGRYGHQGGVDYARRLLAEWRGDEGEHLLDQMVADARITSFHFLAQLSPEQLVQFLTDEHPQTVAVTLVHLPASFAAGVLSDFPVSLRSDVAHRIATMDRTSPDVIRRVKSSMRRRLGTLAAARPGTHRDGAGDLARLLNHADRATESSILSRLDAEDPELADAVRSRMFVFDDIARLDSKDVQEILRTVDGKRLAMAVKDVPDDVRDSVYENLSERVLATLQEEVEFLGAVRVKEAETARREVVGMIRQLDDDGRITIRLHDEGLVE